MTILVPGSTTIAISEAPEVSAIAEAPSPPLLSVTSSLLNPRTDKGYPRWLDYLDQRLDELSSYPESPYDPDEYPRPTDNALVGARNFFFSELRPESPTPYILPNYDRTVLLLWHRAGWEVEVTIAGEEINLWAHNIRTGDVWFGPWYETRQRFGLLLDVLDGSVLSADAGTQ